MSIPATDQMEGVELEAPSESRLMTDDELRVLEVYDRLETLQLEIALLRAQGILSQGVFACSYFEFDKRS